MESFQSSLMSEISNEDSSVDRSYLGPRRSIIRRIGTQLPLGSADRPIFEVLPDGTHGVKARGSSRKMTLFSLADIMQLDEVKESSVPIRASASVPNLSATMSDIPVSTSMSTMPVAPAPQDKMVTKITALEDELAFLRSQIAMLVTSQQNQTVNNASTFDVSISSNLEPPYCTSTPIKCSQAIPLPATSVPPPPPLPPGIPPPPPPPPPPPLVPAAKRQEYMSVQDVIRQRKMAKSQSTSDLSMKQTNTLSQTSVPNMADVLKDLHKVKLKSVSRSPGGTPFNTKKNDIVPVAGDPASLIAAALKKKFAHRKNFESPRSDEQNNSASSFDLNPVTPKKNNFESPDRTPKFGQHLLRRRNTAPPPAVKPKPEVPGFLAKRRNLENVEPAS